MEEYFVALFDEYTSMVPKAWLNFEKKTLYWPPGPVTKILMKNMIPNEKWSSHKWKKILGPYDFAKACRIEQETINMSTDDTLKTPEKEISTKRIRRKPAKYSPNEETSANSPYSSFNEEDGSDSSSPQTTPAALQKPVLDIVSDFLITAGSSNHTNNETPKHPLSLSPANKSVGNVTDENDLEVDSSVEDTVEQEENYTDNNKENPVQTKNKEGNKNGTGPKNRRMPMLQVNTTKNNEYGNETVPGDDATEIERVTPSPPLNKESSTESNKANSSKGSRKRRHENENGSDNPYKRYATVEDLKNMHKKIIRSNKHKELSQTDEILDDESNDLESQLNLPLKTVDEVKKFDSLLKNDASVLSKLKLLIRKIDGPNEASFIYKCLERIMTNNVALQYSYSGQTRGKNKEYKTICFKKLKLYEVLKRTIVYSKITYTEHEFVRCIKRWLNYAKQRIEQAEAKEANEESDENSDVTV